MKLEINRKYRRNVNMDKYIIVTTLCNKKEIAEKIQDTLLEKRLIAGCQISERESKYWWDGKLEKSHEYHIEMRTKEVLFNEIENEIKKIHDYEVAEISYFYIDGASKEILDWIEKETKE
jgi:periplasmic divalent cation tolerance protein